MKNRKELAGEISSYCRKLKKLGFLAGFSGNLSARTGKNSFLITPSATDKGEIKPEDILEMNLDGSIMGRGLPSSEWKMHAFLYRKYQSVQSVIHTHPPFISVFSCSSITIDRPLMAEFLIMLKGMPKTPYFTPGSAEVEKSLAKYAGKNNVLILSNHGLLTFGQSLKNAFALTEEAEHFAKIYYFSLLLGRQSPIKSRYLSALKKLSENFNL